MRWHRSGEDHPPPEPGIEYISWLDAAWNGDARELREGRYLQQQGDLERSFVRSAFWDAVRVALDGWAREYEATTGFALFQAIPNIPALKLKPWTSFLSRNWRHNVRSNDNWPNSPTDGWLFPDTWFERSWDIVRTRFIVRYLDGVTFLADRLVDCAKMCGLPAERREHAQEWGYYAMHVVVPQDFRVQTLTYEEQDDRSSRVEIQITTELQEVVTTLTHSYFEQSRQASSRPGDAKWQWRYDQPGFGAYYLGHMIHYLEGTVMQMRTTAAVDNPWLDS